MRPAADHKQSQSSHVDAQAEAEELFHTQRLFETGHAHTRGTQHISRCLRSETVGGEQGVGMWHGGEAVMAAVCEAAVCGVGVMDPKRRGVWAGGDWRDEWKGNGVRGGSLLVG